MYLRMDPDYEYAKILAEPDKCEKAISFLRKEAKSLAKLKLLLDNCKTSTDYKFVKNEMLECVDHIRTSKIECLEDQFGFFDFRGKLYFKMLIEDLIKR